MKNFQGPDNRGGGAFRGGAGKQPFQNKSWGVDRGQSYGSDRDKQMFKATCSECGKSCEVPFRPTGDKPVFCSDCFNKKRESSDTRGGAPKRDFNDRHAPRPDSRAPFKPVSDDTKKQLSDISFKLDKLISAIEKMSSPSITLKPEKESPIKVIVKKVVSKKKVVVKKKK